MSSAEHVLTGEYDLNPAARSRQSLEDLLRAALGISKGVEAVAAQARANVDWIVACSTEVDSRALEKLVASPLAAGSVRAAMDAARSYIPDSIFAVRHAQDEGYPDLIVYATTQLGIDDLLARRGELLAAWDSEGGVERSRVHISVRPRGVHV